MKAIQIIGRLREKYSNKYTQTPNKDKDYYIRWLQDEYAELAMKQANGVNTEKEALHIDSVMPHFSVSLVYRNIKSIMLRALILNAKDEANALVETIEYFKKETDGMGLVLKAVIELNEA